MSNSSLANDLPPLPSYHLTPLPYLLPPIPDKLLTLLLPVVAYWGVSMLFHWIDVKDYFSQYRLHTPAEVLKRNHVSRWEVVRDVVIQQIIQTAVGIAIGTFEPPDFVGKEDYDVAIWARRIRLAQRSLPRLFAMVGINSVGLAKSMASYPLLAGALAGGQYQFLTQTIITEAGQKAIAPSFAGWELLVAKFLYWYLVPALQFALAIFVVDTWQYFLHRAMHMNKWLYTTFHSRHHRLYVPYAFGALYNHPFEGFLLDTLGTGIAFMLAGMTTRQGMWFFTGSTIKTVDDHCGYAFPWDPLQRVTSNNATYHDVHHQSWGIKTNFSQPFFTFWDRFLGTVWVGGDVSARYERFKIAAQKEVDQQQGIASNGSITGTPGTPVSGSLEVPTRQALESREQVLSDKHNGGPRVLAEEAEEEDAAARSLLTRSMRRKTGSLTPQSDGLKGLRGRVIGSMHGRSSAILGMDGGH